MKIERVQHLEIDGNPVLHMVIDGRPADFYPEDSRLLAVGGMLMLKPDWEGKVRPLILKADPARGNRRDSEVEPATDDPDVIAVYRNWYAQINTPWGYRLGEIDFAPIISKPGKSVG